jgi:hypothetical protein
MCPAHHRRARSAHPQAHLTMTQAESVQTGNQSDAAAASVRGDAPWQESAALPVPLLLLSSNSDLPRCRRPSLHFAAVRQHACCCSNPKPVPSLSCSSSATATCQDNTSLLLLLLPRLPLPLLPLTNYVVQDCLVTMAAQDVMHDGTHIRRHGAARTWHRCCKASSPSSEKMLQCCRSEANHPSS